MLHLLPPLRGRRGGFSGMQASTDVVTALHMGVWSSSSMDGAACCRATLVPYGLVSSAAQPLPNSAPIRSILKKHQAILPIHAGQSLWSPSDSRGRG